MGLLRDLSKALGLETSAEREEHGDLRGWSVVDDTGGVVGRVDDVIYDEDVHQLRYVVVNLEGRRVLLPIGDVRFEDNLRRLVARGYTRERLMSLRSYDAGTWNEERERLHYAEHHPDWKVTDRLDYGTRKFRPEMIPQAVQRLEDRLRMKRPGVTGGRERELTFSGTEPTEADRLERERLNRSDIDTDVNIVPEDTNRNLP